ncbi:MAG: hypothetical protein RQ752_00470 [Thermohalobaculum sp.]|nr:hypothetical protein [Thermohalobaculum sp.]
MNRMTRSAAATLLSLSAAVPAMADAVPRALVGDWDCGATRLVITRLGSIEVVGGAYRAGLFEARGAVLDVTWDSGGTARLTAAREGERLRVEGLGAPLDCTARR